MWELSPFTFPVVPICWRQEKFVYFVCSFYFALKLFLICTWYPDHIFDNPAEYGGVQYGTIVSEEQLLQAGEDNYL